MEDEILGIAGPLVNGVAEVLSRSGYGMVVVPDGPHGSARYFSDERGISVRHLRSNATADCSRLRRFRQ
ncbi:hypothetical protein [Rhizobium sp. Root708]|uniref:hypothetical protein n=1 Tax=Rhizobium sp. Root708 TaxID=1736592 RepID=UPI001FCCCA94|nr:hypothetical protein [Rhizobium sp. Root708]